MMLHTLRAVTTQLRKFPGGVLIGERFRAIYGKHRTNQWVKNFDGDLNMLLDLGEHMQSQIFWHGSYSRDIVSLLRQVVRPGMTIVDGGANVGEITLVCAKLVGPAGVVVAYEPVTRFADQLENNVRANDFCTVRLRRAGLSDAPGQADIYLADSALTDGTHNDGLGSLFPTSERSRLEETIPLTTLDIVADQEALGRIDLIKLDIEGGELAALRGARRVLERDGPAIIVEVAEVTCRAAGYEMADILSHLAEFGYAFQTIGRNGRLSPLKVDALAPFQNVYCVRRADVAAP